MNKGMIAAIWGGSLVAAYWFGLFYKPDGGTFSPETVGESVSFKEVISLPVKDSDSRGIDLKEITDNELPPSSKPIGKEKFHNEPKENENVGELVASHPIKRLKAFAELLENPNAQTIEYAVEAYESLPGGPGRLSELKLLAFAWGQVDPEGGLTWVKKQQHWDKHIASSSIMDSWARYDADAAIAWAKENFDGDDNPFFVGIINGLSESNLVKATDLMTELPYGRVRGRSAHILFEKVWNKGEEVAIHWAEHLPEGSLQNFAYGELGEKVARTDISRAIKWVDSMKESSIKSSVSEDVAREVAKQNPLAAGEWVLTMEDGDAQQVGMREVAKIWSRDDPAATAGWINQFPAETNVDVAIELLVKQMTSTDPAGALRWAETVSDAEKRKKLIEDAEMAIKAQKFPDGKSD